MSRLKFRLRSEASIALRTGNTLGDPLAGRRMASETDHSGTPIRSGAISYVKTKLVNQAMSDGSRKFAALPQTKIWFELRDHLLTLPGLAMTDFICDGITEAWIVFTYRGYSFSVNDQYGEYWFFVDEPRCPDDALAAILSHCGRLLRP